MFTNGAKRIGSSSSFKGNLIRESAKTNSKTVAREAERARRREIELAVNRIPKRERMPLFSVAAKEWLASRVALAANTLEAYEHFVETLTEQFGKRLVCDIDDQDISALQRKRLAEQKSARTVNFEINVLRQILKAHGLWGTISDKVKSLRERRDVGRAISSMDEKRLIDAASEEPLARTSAPVDCQLGQWATRYRNTIAAPTRSNVEMARPGN